MVKDAKDDGYMESVVRGTLASMYVGKFPAMQLFSPRSRIDNNLF
jgi:hypothetical protein